MMVALIRGKHSVVFGSELNARTCITIALRHSGLIKAFRGQIEKPILSYQTHKYRIVIGLPKLMEIHCGHKFIQRIYE